MDKILVAEPLADEGLQLLRAQAEVDTWDARGARALAEGEGEAALAIRIPIDCTP